MSLKATFLRYQSSGLKMWIKAAKKFIVLRDISVDGRNVVNLRIMKKYCGIRTL